MEALKKEQTSIFNNNLDEIYNIYNEEWIDNWYRSVEEKNEFYDKGKEILKNFYNNFKEDCNILLINNELALEKSFQLKINGDIIIGTIDRIDEVKGGVEIIDYKTGSPKKTLTKEDKLQLLIYALASKKVLGLNPVKLTYYYLEDCSKASFNVKDEIIEKTELELKEIINKIKRSNFKPSSGWHCQFCDFRDICVHKKN